MDKSLSLRFDLEDVRFTLEQICIYEAAMYSVPYYYQHDHSSYELHYVTEGSCTLDCNGQQYVLSPGCMILIPPHRFHRIYGFSDPIGKIAFSYRVQLPIFQNRNTKSLQFFNMFQPNDVIYLDQDSRKKQHLRASVEQLANFAFFSDDSPFAYWSKLSSLSRICMVDLFELLQEQQPAPFPYESPVTSTESIIDNFFNLNYDGSRSREELAQMLNVSSRHLDRILQERYGMSYRRRISMTRLRTAQDFLTTTDMSIVEISELLGYENPANFSNFIKRETGKSPSEIRKEKQRTDK